MVISNNTIKSEKASTTRDAEKTATSLGLHSSLIAILLVFYSLSEASFSVNSYPGFVYFNIHFTTIIMQKILASSQTFL